MTKRKRQKKTMWTLRLGSIEEALNLYSVLLAFQRSDGGGLINPSRGAIIDEGAFVANLESGKVAAAGIDVIHGEWMADITQHPLVQYAQTHDNLVISPHFGGATAESIAGARIFTAEKLARYLAGL